MGIDLDGCPFTLFKTVSFKDGTKNPPSTVSKEPINFLIKKDTNKEISINLEFQGHYNEPTFTFNFNQVDAPLISEYHISFNPSKDNKWTLKSVNDQKN